MIKKNNKKGSDQLRAFEEGKSRKSLASRNWVNKIRKDIGKLTLTDQEVLELSIMLGVEAMFRAPNLKLVPMDPGMKAW